MTKNGLLSRISTRRKMSRRATILCCVISIQEIFYSSLYSNNNKYGCCKLTISVSAYISKIQVLSLVEVTAEKCRSANSRNTFYFSLFNSFRRDISKYCAISLLRMWSSGKIRPSRHFPPSGDSALRSTFHKLVRTFSIKKEFVFVSLVNHVLDDIFISLSFVRTCLLIYQSAMYQWHHY